MSRMPSSRNKLARILVAIVGCVGVFLIAEPALACSVCYGDPNSGMVQGAKAGVLVLLGVVGVVLTGVASVLIFWMRRAAKLGAEVEAAEAAARHSIVSVSQTPLSHA